MELKASVMSSFFWRFLEQFGNQAIQFITQILLARLLMPEEFGLMAMITIFISFGKVFVDAGFGQALIQRKTIDDEDKSSILMINIIVSFVAYSLIFLSAPYIANFYKVSILSLILRVQAIVIIIDAFSIVQYSILVRNMRFKDSFIISLGSTFVQGLTGTLLAYNGFGVWALVFSQICRSITHTFLLWIRIKWKPSKKFSLKKIKALYGFGIGILGTSLLNSIISNIQSIVIGKNFNAELLGYYNRGDSLPLIAINSVNEPIKAVLFPAMSKVQDSHESVKNTMSKIMLIGSFFVFPLMFLLAIIAEPLVLVLLTDKWSFSITFIQLASLKYAFSPMHSANLEAMKAIGRSDVFFKLSVIKNSITVAILFATLPFGIHAVALGGVFSSLISLLINIVPNSRLIGYRLRDQIIDILPNALLTLLTGAIVLILGQIIVVNSNIALIMLKTITGIIIYLITAILFKVKALDESFGLIKMMFKMVTRHIKLDKKI